MLDHPNFKVLVGEPENMVSNLAKTVLFNSWIIGMTIAKFWAEVIMDSMRIDLDSCLLL